MENRLTVWYLSHSGFAVEYGRQFLVFDYYKNTPRGGLAKGVIDPAALAYRDVTVFVSHSHYDHMNPDIFKWAQMVPGIRYVLDDSVRVPSHVLKSCGEQITMVSPHRSYDVGALSVRTLLSTDLGVAYLVRAGKATLYHAGDLNWWHWDDEPEKTNLWMKETYQREIDSLKGEHIDAAFLPLDPRQEHNHRLGMDYFMRRVGARYVFPMHFWERYSVIRTLKASADAKWYSDRVLPITHRGESFVLPINA